MARKNKTPFFIIGSPRSGTTLLERLLNRHPGIVIPPETAFFFKLKNNGFLDQETGEKTLEEGVDFYLGTRPARLLKLHEIEDIEKRLLANAFSYVDVFLNLLDVLTAGEEFSCLGEKTPHHLRCIDYITENFPDSPIIAMIRDGRAVVNSQRKHPNWGENLLAASQAWKNDQTILNDVLKRQKNRFHITSYENLLMNPEEEIKKICDYLDIDYHQSMLETDEDSQDKYNEYYQQSWMKKSTGRIDASRSDAWKREYSDKELALVQYVIGEELEAFGYRLTRTSNQWEILWLKEFFRYVLFRMKRKLCKTG